MVPVLDIIERILFNSFGDFTLLKLIVDIDLGPESKTDRYKSKTCIDKILNN